MNIVSSGKLGTSTEKRKKKKKKRFVTIIKFTGGLADVGRCKLGGKTRKMETRLE